jgi:putative Holliday junction resolvase
MEGNMKEEYQLIKLVDEEEQDHEFYLVNIVEIDGQKYAVLLPRYEYEKNEDCKAVIFRIEEDEVGEEILVDIEDDEEFERVVEYLDELYVEDLN